MENINSSSIFNSNNIKLGHLVNAIDNHTAKHILIAFAKFFSGSFQSLLEYLNGFKQIRLFHVKPILNLTTAK